MRKQILKSLIMGAAMLGATAMTASAGTEYFIVGSSVAYTLTAKDDAGAALPAGAEVEWFAASGGAPTGAALSTIVTFDGTGDNLTGATAATEKTYMMHYKTSSAADCWSDYQTIVVYTLPPLVVTVTPDNQDFCSNADLDVTLTAAVTNWSSYDFTVLGTTNPSPVDYLSFTWSASPSLTIGTPTGTHGETLVQTLPASSTSYTFTATTNYKGIDGSTSVQGGTTISGYKLASDYSGSNTAAINVTTAPSAPTVTIQ